MDRIDLTLEIRVHNNPKKNEIIDRIKDILYNASLDISDMVLDEFDSQFTGTLESEKEDYCNEIVEIHYLY